MQLVIDFQCGAETTLDRQLTHSAQARYFLLMGSGEELLCDC